MILPIGFLTQSNNPHINKNDRFKHNIFRSISYIPVVSAIPAIYKIFMVAKVCLEKCRKKIEINIDQAYNKMIDGFQKDIESQYNATTSLTAIGKDLLENIDQFEHIKTEIERAKSNQQYDLSTLAKLNTDYKKATKEFYGLINKPFTHPKKYPIQIFIDALKHNENVSKAKMTPFKQLASIALRACIFEIAPIGWSLIPVDLFATYCCKQTPTRKKGRIRL